MTPDVDVSAEARADLDRQIIWHREHAGSPTAVRLAREAVATFARLLASPQIGSPVPSGDPALSDLRKWRVQGFARLLIFYRATDRGITVVRVLHTAQDWAGLLDL